MIRLSEVDIRKLKKRAMDEMLAGRDNTLGEAARVAERSWKYGEGKKTATKVAVGTTVGVAIAGIGAATHGAGIPVIIGLAIGGFTVGQMSDMAFAKAWGRQYTGGKRTQEWLNHPQVIDTFGKSKLLEERAHKTVRRAFQHFRTACENARNLHLVLRSPQTCDQAFDMMSELLGVKRHLDKARLYIFPAMFLAHHVLDYYDQSWKQWSGKDDKAANASWHPQKFCVISTNPDECVYTGHARPAQSAQAKPLPGIPWNPGTFNVHDESHLLDDLATRLGTDPVLRLPYPGQFRPGVQRMFDAAEQEYNENRTVTKLKHGVTNPLLRKTTGEQTALGVKKGASVLLAGGSIGAHIHADEAFGALAMLIDAAFSSPDLLIEEGVEGIGNDVQPQRPDIELQREGAKAGAEAQEGLRKAAVHLWETGNVMGRISEVNNGGYDFTGTSCKEAVEYLRQVYKIQHHLLKTQKYLTETIEQITDLAERIDKGLTALTNVSNIAFKSIDRFMGEHAYCMEGRCWNKVRYLFPGSFK